MAMAILVLCAAARAQSGATTPAPVDGSPVESANTAPGKTQKVVVTGQGDKLGTGLLMNEDAAKARSSVTKAELEKTRSSGNPFQALALLPGVNSSSYDATGLFGGSLRVRGFNSDQMGFTVNGAPVNDSGSFSVYPAEYVDSENLCSLYVTQGAADTDSPHVGASGGNVGLVSCAPEDKQRVRVGISAGQLGFTRDFIRADTGKLGDFKGFVSISKSYVRKWKGTGIADREHIDAGAEYDLGGGNLLSASLLYNRAINNNFLALTPAQFAQYGYYTDFSPTPPSHLTPVKGTAQNETSVASPTLPTAAYFNYALNPFQNYLLSAKASFVLSQAARLSIQPYFWYGYGTGGTQQTSVQESSGSTMLHGGIADINGDGDTLDKVLVYRGSVTQTGRPGVSAQVSYALDDQDIVFGVWAERAHHRQTQPGTTVDSSGHAGDIWLRTNLLKYADGTTYQGRNWVTVSTAASAFVQDNITLLDNTLKITPALSLRTIERDFTNIANSGSGGGADYKINKTYTEPLPSLALSLQATSRVQVFASATKSFRVPSNFEYGYLGQGVTYVNGVGTATGLAAVTVKPEVAINMDLGARYRGDLFTASATAFLNKFRDRIASSYDPVQATTHDWNVGRSTTKGLELEAGTVPFHGYSAYASATYTRSTLEDDMIASATTSYATAGKQFPDSPKGMASLSLQYAEGPALINVSGKYQSSRFLTLVNDQAIAGYTTYDLNAAYKLPNLFGNLFKDPVIRLNVSNLFDKKGFEANSGSGSNVGITAANNPTVYALAPRFTSMAFQVDF
jgi:iron complex outermembrane receptor protein